MWPHGAGVGQDDTLVIQASFLGEAVPRAVGHDEVEEGRLGTVLACTGPHSSSGEWNRLLWEGGREPHAESRWSCGHRHGPLSRPLWALIISGARNWAEPGSAGERCRYE